MKMLIYADAWTLKILKEEEPYEYDGSLSLSESELSMKISRRVNKNNWR